MRRAGQIVIGALLVAGWLTAGWLYSEQRQQERRLDVLTYELYVTHQQLAQYRAQEEPLEQWRQRMRDQALLMEAFPPPVVVVQ